MENMLFNQINEEMNENPFTVLSLAIYNGIYKSILNGYISTEDKIVESKIAKDLNVSRTPVKMALTKLCNDNVLERGAGKEFRVKRITYVECLWLYETRMAIESEGAYFAARRITKNELVQLKKIIDQFREIDISFDHEKYISCDKKFHELIIKASRNKYMIDMYKLIESPLQRYRHQTLQFAYEDLFVSNNMERSSSFHIAIYKALYNHLSVVARDEIQNDIKRMYGTIHMLKFVNKI